VSFSRHFRIMLVLTAIPLVACVTTATVTPSESGRGVSQSRASVTRRLTPLPTAALKGRVLLPASLINEVSGALVSNNAGSLIANNAGSFVADVGAGVVVKGAAGFSLLQTGARQDSLDERPVKGIRVMLTDASGKAFNGLPSVFSDAQGQFEIPDVPEGLIYTVVATLVTPKGNLKVSALTVSGVDTVVSLATTVALTQMQRASQRLWGRLDKVAYTKVVTGVAKQLTPEDARLALVEVADQEASTVWARLESQAPELKADLQSVLVGLKQVSTEMEAIAENLRGRSPAPSPATGVDASSSPPGAITSAADIASPTASPSTEPDYVPGVQVTTVAGTSKGSVDGPVNVAQFNGPDGLAVDTSGNIYVTESSGYIRTVTPAGLVTTWEIPGLGPAYGGWKAITVNRAGVIYVTDSYSQTIRMLTKTGVPTVTTGLNYPSGLAADAAGDLYVADKYNQRIIKVTPQGVVSTLAGSTPCGTGCPGGFADGTGAAAQFNYPGGVAVDAAGNVYVADPSNNRIRKVTPQGAVSTLAGSTKGYADGTGSAAQFSSPSGVAVDVSGNVYVTDSGNSRIRRISPLGVVKTVAGSTVGLADGTGRAAQFSNPSGVAVDATGHVYVTDSGNHRIRKVTMQ